MKKFKFSKLPPPNYTPEERETLRKLVEFNKVISDSIDKVGMEKTGVAFLLASYKAFGWDE